MPERPHSGESVESTAPSRCEPAALSAEREEEEQPVARSFVEIPR